MAVSTREIPREEWGPFFDEFSRRREGWIVSVEIVSPELGAQEETAGLPLVGIGVDRRGEIEIIVGWGRDRHLTHIINDAHHVWLAKSQESRSEALNVESEDGIATLVHFSRIATAERQLSH
jgi:hypothetical protein